MEKRVRRSFSKQFKDDAVRQIVDGGKRLVDVGNNAGVPAGLVGRWVREASERGADRFVGKGHQSALEEEIRRLKRENARLLEERTILKKAARFMILEKV